MYATFSGIEIPRIFDVQVRHENIGERTRTAGGKLRSDTIVTKRIWTLQTGMMPLAVANVLLSHLRGTRFAEGAFWIKGLDAPVIASIDPNQLQEEVVAFGEDGVWHNDGRRLTIVVEEV